MLLLKNLAPTMTVEDSHATRLNILSSHLNALEINRPKERIGLVTQQAEVHSSSCALHLAILLKGLYLKE